MVLDYQPMDLKKTMNEAISPLGFKAEEKGVILNLTINDTCKNGIVCDSVRLKQIVINLISNAIKFTEKGSVNFSINSEDGEDGKKLLNFKVADTGIGIPKDIQASIFDDFKQADSSINKKYGGTGLGLSICKKLIELMGGEITLESEVGEGAVFRFQLEVETISLEKEKENRRSETEARRLENEERKRIQELERSLREEKQKRRDAEIAKDEEIARRLQAQESSTPRLKKKSKPTPEVEEDDGQSGDENENDDETPPKPEFSESQKCPTTPASSGPH